MGMARTRRERAGIAARFAGLSPRRRLLVVAVTVVVAAVSVASVVGAVSGRTSNPAESATGRNGLPWAAPAQDRPGPVVLVPGYGGSTGSLDPLASRIRATGRAATVLQLPAPGTGSLLADAAQLDAAVNGYLHQGAPSVDVIGYSAGGVVALIWARHDDGAARARRVITLGAPFHGTQLAAAAAVLSPGACPTACRQLVPGSSLLDSLDVANPAGLPRWMSLWTRNDQVVTPPESALLSGAIDVSVQSVCPAANVTHSQLPTSPVVVAMVLQAIGPSPLVRPTAADCSAVSS
jgi:triacylglycerol esterase/lipase EstA (alpha/beta hydrolase family)